MATRHVGIDATDVVNGLEDYKRAAHQAIIDYALSKCPELETYMRQHTPWEDRTGTARSELRAVVDDMDKPLGEVDIVRIELSSPAINERGQAYGHFLEHGTVHAKPYPILKPTVLKRGPKIVSGLKGVLKKIKVR